MEFGVVDVGIKTIFGMPRQYCINRVWNVVWFTSNIDAYTNVCKFEDNYSSHQFLLLWFISITTQKYNLPIYNWYHILFFPTLGTEIQTKYIYFLISKVWLLENN
jgi:hypothetical protein